jgi:hypothetical protein
MFRITPEVAVAGISCALIFLAVWVYREASSIEATRLQRAAVKTAIHDEVSSRYSMQVVASDVHSRCGIPVYRIQVQGIDGGADTLHYNLETGQSVDSHWVDKCLRKY